MHGLRHAVSRCFLTLPTATKTSLYPVLHLCRVRESRSKSTISGVWFRGVKEIRDEIRLCCPSLKVQAAVAPSRGREEKMSVNPSKEATRGQSQLRGCPGEPDEPLWQRAGIPLESRRAADSTSSNTTAFWCNFPSPELRKVRGD